MTRKICEIYVVKNIKTNICILIYFFNRYILQLSILRFMKSM